MRVILCHDAVMQQLRGKVAVVTGAASGIGLALTERLRGEGMQVIGVDLEGTDHVTDVSDYESVAALADHVFAEAGGIDVLCNNAGVFAGGLMWERPATDFTSTLGVNLWGILNGIRAFVPRMLASGRPGHIVNTVSMAGLSTTPYAGPYIVSKFAAMAATECLAHDLAAIEAPIKVSAVVPGSVATKIATSARHRPPQLAAPRSEDAEFVESALADTTAQGSAPDDVAAMIVDAIRSDTFLVPTRADYVEHLRERYDALIERTLPPMRIFG
jgi:NAD(P)-dependent dehydrogenase (short-subunit alcohol dehydrogenase family)